MNCPNCGSKQIQTIIHNERTQKDYSLPGACCGYLIFGAWGLLCGLCGGGTRHTDYTIHICQNCGRRF